MDYLKKNTYFLMRHGEGTQNVAGIISSSHTEKKNPPHLTENGIEQVKESTEKLAEEKIDYIFASPYMRTMETADIVADKLGLDISKEERLRETETGEFDGKSYADWAKFFEGKDELTVSPPGGESMMDVRARVEDFLDGIHEKFEGKNILIVSHGDPLLMMESVLRGVVGKEIFNLSYPETGGFKKLGK